MSEPFQVNFFTNYEGDRQFSMLRYADQLEAALKRDFSSVCNVHRYAPRYGGKKAGGLLSRFKRFVEYPYLARTHWGPVNHIADHGNSHLLNFLPPERTVVTCHDLIPLRLADRLEGFNKRTQYSFRAKVIHMRKAACIMTDSESTRQDVIALLGIPAERVRCVYLGLNHADFYPLQAGESKDRFRQAFNFSWAFTLLHVGAASFYKNLEGVIETLALLRGRHHLDVHLARVGSPLTTAQEELVRRHGLQSQIHTLKLKDDAQLRELYLASDAILYPSWWEGFGWPPLEALACGTPVVASNRGSLPEITGTAALQINPEDASAMADAVRRVFDDGALRDQLRAAGLIQAAKFPWRKTAEEAAHIYRSVWEKTHA